MNKKIITLASMLLIFTLVLMASAETAGIPISVFDTAKTALRYMSEGDLGQAIRLMNAESWLSVSQLKQTIDMGCRELYNIQVQTDYSVAWQSPNGLFLAVPVTEPADGFVDTLVYSLNSSYQFTGIYFIKWADVDRQLGSGTESVWHEPYVPSYRIFED